LIIDLRWWVFF